MDANKLAACCAAIVGAACVVVAATPVSASAAAIADISVRVGSATLRPAVDGGYTGIVPVRITHTGQAAVAQRMRVNAPAGLYFQPGSTGPYVACWQSDGPFTVECDLADGPNGETVEIQLPFRALAKPIGKSRLSLTGSITVTTVDVGQEIIDPTPGDNTARFRVALAGTGHGFDPRPYRPSTRYDLVVTVAERVAVFAPDPAGGYRAPLTLTLRARTDAYHFDAYLTVLNGWSSLWLGQYVTCWMSELGASCPVGRQLAQDHPITVTAYVRTDAPPAPGTEIALRGDINTTFASGDFAADTRPEDNVVTLPVG